MMACQLQLYNRNCHFVAWIYKFQQGGGMLTRDHVLRSALLYLQNLQLNIYQVKHYMTTEYYKSHTSFIISFCINAWIYERRKLFYV